MFNAINHILFEKPDKEINASALDEFSPYMVNRYFSFYSNGDYVDYINDTTNMYHSIFNTSEEQYKFFENIVPKLKKRKINYVKRIKKNENTDEVVKQIPDFYSRREWEALTNYEI
jgi:hypothetical protein